MLSPVEPDPENLTYEDLERLDYISVELVPERKGLILKHSEYAVSSRRYGTTVMRRYSDFVALHDALLAKYPYSRFHRARQGALLGYFPHVCCWLDGAQPRQLAAVVHSVGWYQPRRQLNAYHLVKAAVCRLPPKRVVVGGGSAVFLERRRAALQRWLGLTAAHPVLAHDADTRAFLCETRARIERPHHDEFALAAAQLTSQECITEEMQNAFSSEQEELRLVQLGLMRLSQVYTHAEERCVAERSEVRELGAALAALSAPPTAGEDTPSWVRVRTALRRAATLAGRASDNDDLPIENEAEYRLRLALDAVSAHRDLCARLTRGLHAERARAAARSTSLAHAAAASTLRARHCYAMSCAAHEARVARAYALAALESLPELLHTHAVTHARVAALWSDLCKALQRDTGTRVP